MSVPVVTSEPLSPPPPPTSTWTTKQKVGLGVGLAVAVIIIIVLVVVLAVPKAEEAVARNALIIPCRMQIYNGVDALQPIDVDGWRTLAPVFKLRLSDFHANYLPLTAMQLEAGEAPQSMTLTCYWQEEAKRTPLHWKQEFASTADPTVSLPVPTGQTHWEPLVQLPTNVDPTFHSQLVLEAVGNAGVVTSEPLRLSRLMADVALSLSQSWTVDKSTYEVDIQLDADIISSALLPQLQLQMKLVPMSLTQSFGSGATDNSLDAATDAIILSSGHRSLVTQSMDQTISIDWTPDATQAPFSTWTIQEAKSYYIIIKTLNLVTLTDWEMGREFRHVSPTAYVLRKTSDTTMVMGTALIPDVTPPTIPPVPMNPFAIVDLPLAPFPGVGSGDTFTFRIISTTGLHVTPAALPDNYFVFNVGLNPTFQFIGDNILVVVSAPTLSTITLPDTRQRTTRTYTASLERINPLLPTYDVLQFKFHETRLYRNITALAASNINLTLLQALPANFLTMFPAGLEKQTKVFSFTGLTATASNYPGSLADIQNTLTIQLATRYTWTIQTSGGVPLTSGLSTFTHVVRITGVTAVPLVGSMNVHAITFGMEHTFSWFKGYSANEGSFAMKVAYQTDDNGATTTRTTDSTTIRDQDYIAPTISFSGLTCNSILSPDTFTQLTWNYVVTGTKTYSDLSRASVSLSVVIGTAAAITVPAADISLTLIQETAATRICTARLTLTPSGALATLFGRTEPTDACAFTLTLHPRGTSPAEATTPLTATFFWRRSAQTFRLTDIAPNGSSDPEIHIPLAGATISRPLQLGRYISPGQMVGTRINYAWSAVGRTKTLTEVLNFITPTLSDVQTGTWTLDTTNYTLEQLKDFAESNTASNSRVIRYRLYCPAATPDEIYFAFALSRAAYAHISQQSNEQLFKFTFSVPNNADTNGTANANATGTQTTTWPNLPLIVCPSIHLATPVPTSIYAYRDRVRLTVNSTHGLVHLPGTSRTLHLQYNDANTYTNASGQLITTPTFVECEPGVVLHTQLVGNAYTTVTTLPEQGVTYLSYRLNLFDIYRIIAGATTNQSDTRLLRVRCVTTGNDGVNFLFPHPLDTVSSKTSVSLSYVADKLKFTPSPWISNIPFSTSHYNNQNYEVGVRYALNRALDDVNRLTWVLESDRLPLHFNMEITSMSTSSSTSGRTPTITTRLTTENMFVRSTATGYTLTADRDVATTFTMAVGTNETPMLPIVQRTTLSTALSGQVGSNINYMPTQYATLELARVAAQDSNNSSAIRIEVVGSKYRLSDNPTTPATSTTATYHQIYKNMYQFTSDVQNMGYYPLHINLDAMSYKYTPIGENAVANIQIDTTIAGTALVTPTTSIMSWKTLSDFMRTAVSGTGVTASNVFSEASLFAAVPARTALSTGNSITYINPNPGATTSIYKPIIYNVDQGLGAFLSPEVFDGKNTSLTYFGLHSRVATQVADTAAATHTDFYWQHVGKYQEAWPLKSNVVDTPHAKERFYVFGREMANSTTVNDLTGFGHRGTDRATGRVCNPEFFYNNYNFVDGNHSQCAMQVLSYTSTGAAKSSKSQAVWTTLSGEWMQQRHWDQHALFVLPPGSVVRWGRTGQHINKADGWWVLKPTKPINRQPRPNRVWWQHAGLHQCETWTWQKDPRLGLVSIDSRPSHIWDSANNAEAMGYWVTHNHHSHLLSISNWNNYYITMPTAANQYYSLALLDVDDYAFPARGYGTKWNPNVLQFLGKIRSTIVANAQMEQREVGPIYERSHIFSLRHTCAIHRELAVNNATGSTVSLGMPATISAFYIALEKWPKYTYISLRIKNQRCTLTPICYTSTPQQDKVQRCLLPIVDVNPTLMIEALSNSCIPKPSHYLLAADPLTELTTNTDTQAKRLASPLSHGVLGFRIFNLAGEPITVNHNDVFDAEIIVDALASADVQLIGVRTTTSAPKAHLLCASFELTYADYTMDDVMV